MKYLLPYVTPHVCGTVSSKNDWKLMQTFQDRCHKLLFINLDLVNASSRNSSQLVLNSVSSTAGQWPGYRAQIQCYLVCELQHSQCLRERPKQMLCVTNNNLCFQVNGTEMQSSEATVAECNNSVSLSRLKEVNKVQQLISEWLTAFLVQHLDNIFSCSMHTCALLNKPLH